MLLLVLGLSLVPLMLMSFWLTQSGVRSGETLLRSRLDDSVDGAVALIGVRWLGIRSEMLDVWDAPERAVSMDIHVLQVSLRDTLGREFFTWSRNDPRMTSTAAPLPVTLPVYASDGQRRGAVHAALDIAGLLESSVRPQTGGVLAAREPTLGASLLPIPFDPAMLDLSRFEFGGEHWVSEQRALIEPAVNLTAAAPLAPFTTPFRAAAKRGLLLVTATSVAGFFLAVALTGRLTASLERLATDADRVAHGDLTISPSSRDHDEVARVSTALATMSARLRKMIDERAQQEALAALGTFASELAHEVRNPLTSMRLDLQLVHEELPPHSRARATQAGVIDAVDRLDRTVTGVLRLARSGRIERRLIDVRSVIDNAYHTVQPTFGQRQVILVVDADSTIAFNADSDALHQLLTNVLLNAAQASSPGSTVQLEAHRDSLGLTVKVRDQGDGMDAERVQWALKSFSTNRQGGSGLGLPLAERIAVAHGGELSIESTQGHGTSVRVWLPDIGPNAA